MTPRSLTIRFATGTTARAVEAGSDVGGEELVAALGLPAPRATVVLNGSTVDLEPGLAKQLSGPVGRDGLAAAVCRNGFTAITGGTDAGIFSILGRGMTSGGAPLVGVAPRSLVTWPGRPSDGTSPREIARVPLEPHHSHFVLVDGAEWGDERAALLQLAHALGRLAPSVAVICGGGTATRAEALGHVRAGRPVVVLAGSGRFADELAGAVSGRRPDPDPQTAEIAAAGNVTVCPISSGAPGLVAAVLAALWPATGEPSGGRFNRGWRGPPG